MSKTRRIRTARLRAEQRAIARRLEQAVRPNMSGRPVLGRANIAYELSERTRATANGGIGMIDPADIIATGSGQHTPLGQIAHHLLGEKRVPGGPFDDDGGQPADRAVRPEQL